MARRWVAAGHTVTVICGKGDICGLPSESSFEVEGIRIWVVGANYSQKQGFVRRSWAFLYFMVACFCKGLRVRNSEVIFATSTPLTIGIPAMLLKWFKRKPFVFEVRDQWPQVPIEMGIIRNLLLKKLLLWMEKRIYKSAMAIVALSPGMAKGIRRVLGKVRKPILVAPNSADIELFHPNVDGTLVRQKMGWQNKFVVMHFGTMGRANGLDFLIDAAAQLTDTTDLLFVLIGSGREKKRLKEKVQKQNLTNILFLENIAKADLPAWLAACDISTVIFADYPILEHNSANKFFDSLAAGKPVLLNYNGWQREVIENNNAGYGCRQCDLNEYLEKLMCLYRNRNSLQEMGCKARKLAEQEFSRDKIASDVLELIKEVVKQ